MEFIRNLFDTVIVLVPNIVSQIAVNFVLFLANPYKSSRATFLLLKRNHLNSEIMLFTVFFLFAFVMGIPTISEPFFDISEGWQNSIERLNDLDLKGKQFVYLFVFILILSVLTIIITGVIKRFYQLSGHKKIEFHSIFQIFVAFTIGWFLLISVGQSYVFRLLPKVGAYVVGIVTSRVGSTQEMASSIIYFVEQYIEPIYKFYNPIEHGIGTEPTSQHVLILLLTPAMFIILYMTFRFSVSFLNSMSIEPESIRSFEVKSINHWFIRQKTWSIRARTVPAVAIGVLIVGALVVASGLATILFEAVPSETHNENCTITEAKILPNVVRSKTDVKMDKTDQLGAQGKKLFNVNLFYFNSEKKTKVLKELYFVLYDAHLYDEERDRVTKEQPTYNGEDDERMKNDHIVAIARISASQLLWLHGKGLIIEGGERRYFRLQFPLEQIEGGLQQINGAKRIDCKLVLPSAGSEITTREIGSDNWLVNLSGREKKDIGMNVVNVSDVSGDSMSEESVNAARSIETLRQP
jgi:hypothetical protein